MSLRKKESDHKRSGMKKEIVHKENHKHVGWGKQLSFILISEFSWYPLRFCAGGKCLRHFTSPWGRASSFNVKSYTLFPHFHCGILLLSPSLAGPEFLWFNILRKWNFSLLLIEAKEVWGQVLAILAFQNVPAFILTCTPHFISIQCLWFLPFMVFCVPIDLGLSPLLA